MDLPEDLTTVEDDALQSFSDTIAARAAELSEAGDFSEEAVREIEQLAAQADAIQAETDRRSALAAENEARFTEAANRFQGAAEPEAPAAEADPAPEAELAEPVVEAEPVAEPVAAATRGTAGLASRRPAGAAPQASKGGGPRLHASPGVAGKESGAAFTDRSDLAQAIVRKRLSFGTIPTGIREDLTIGSGHKGGFAHSLGQDASENFAVLQQVRQEHMDAVVASGAICVPQTPLLDFYRLAVAQSPVQDALNVAQAPKGGIRFIKPTDYRDARNAVGVVTAAEEAAGYTSETPAGTTAPKLFYRVDCPDVDEVLVDSVYWSIRWGNLKYRVFPELVEAFMEDLAVAFESRKEERHLDYIHANSTQVSGTGAYGASRSILERWTKLASAYRKRNGMARNATVDVFSPDWVVDLVKADMANDGDEGLGYLSIPDSEVDKAVRARGLNPVWFNDSASSRVGDRWAGAQNAGAANDWPANFTSYLFAPGTFVRLDGGSLDVGLVRDSALNRTNDLELFFEEWIGTVKLGIESIADTFSVTANGAGAALVTPY